MPDHDRKHGLGSSRQPQNQSSSSIQEPAAKRRRKDVQSSENNNETPETITTLTCLELDTFIEENIQIPDIMDLRRFNPDISFNKILQIVLLRKLKEKYPDLDFNNEQFRSDYFHSVTYLLKGLDKENSFAFEDVPIDNIDVEEMLKIELKSRRVRKKRFEDLA